jgi:hypothetical protein
MRNAAKVYVRRLRAMAAATTRNTQRRTQIAIRPDFCHVRVSQTGVSNNSGSEGGRDMIVIYWMIHHI